MSTWYVTFDDPYAIEHHGIKGQRWGTRRFQNEDGSLTPAGRERYLKYKGQRDEKFRKASEGYAAAKASGNSKKAARFQKQMKKYQNTTVDDFLRHESNKTKAAVAAAAAVAAVGVGAFLYSRSRQQDYLGRQAANRNFFADANEQASKYQNYADQSMQVSYSKYTSPEMRAAARAKGLDPNTYFDKDSGPWRWAEDSTSGEGFRNLSRKYRDTAAGYAIRARDYGKAASNWGKAGRAGLAVAGAGALGGAAAGAAGYARLRGGRKKRGNKK